MKENQANCSLIRISFVTMAHIYMPQELMPFGPGFMMHSKPMWDNYYNKFIHTTGAKSVSDWYRRGIQELARSEQFKKALLKEHRTYVAADVQKGVKVKEG